MDSSSCGLWALAAAARWAGVAVASKQMCIRDRVTTIGGVIGRVVAIKDDTFVLETGADRVKIRFTKSAISSVEKLNMAKAPADKK